MILLSQLIRPSPSRSKKPFASAIAVGKLMDEYSVSPAAL